MKKIGSMKKWPLKDRFVVLMEYILFCLGQGDVEPADQTATCLMEEREFGKDPDSNMMVGITFCELWNSAIPVKFRSRVSDESHSSGESEMSETNYDASAQNSEENQFTAISENGSSFRPDSETSVRIGKDFGSDANNNENRPISMDVDDDPGKETSHVHSSMTSDDEDSSYPYKKDNMQYTYTFNGPGFESWLMPVKLYSIKKLENSISSHALKEYYKGAIKHLRVALYSSPPLYEALLPLVQMLVLGNYIDEALNELDQFGHSSQMVLPLRAKATIWENIDGKNYWKLSACYEEILKKDPLCGDSLAKLIGLHHRGEYDLQQLLEMIALHLEASYPDSDIWKEFASCFMNLCRCEDDRMSCIGNNDSEIKQGDLISMKTVPEIFTKGKSGKTWKKRCRWWLYRHFSQTILSSEIEAGSLQLLAYKAASASHMYGPEVEYVVKASAHLEDKDRILYSFLQNHMQMADPSPYMDGRLLNFRLCLNRKLHISIWSSILIKAKPIRDVEIERQNRINDLREMRRPFIERSSRARANRASLLAVCKNCARQNCENGWRDLGRDRVRCDYGRSMMSGKRDVKLEFINGDLADNPEALRRLCNCKRCSICGWRRMIPIFRRI